MHSIPTIKPITTASRRDICMGTVGISEGQRSASPSTNECPIEAWQEWYTVRTERSPRGHAHFIGAIRTTAALFQSKRNREAGRDLFLRLRIRCQQIDLGCLPSHPAGTRFYKPWEGEVDLGEGLSGRRWPQIRRQPDLWDPVHDPEAKLRHLPYAPSLSGQAAEYDAVQRWISCPVMKYCWAAYARAMIIAAIEIPNAAQAADVSSAI